MDDDKTRNKIAITFVSVCMLMLGFMIIYPLIWELNGFGNDVEGSDSWISTLENTGFIFTGFIGTIIGYYFGSSSSE